MTGLPTGFTVVMSWDPVGNPSDTSDISAYVRSGTIARGMSRYDGNVPARYSVGTCSLILSNLDARFDPTYTASPYYDGTAGATKLIPDRPTVKISADGFDLFTGYVDAWTLDYPSGGTDATCTLTASDGIKVLNTIQIDMLPGGTGSNGNGDYAGQRVSRILDWVGGFGSRAVDFQDPENAMGPVTDTLASAWSMLQDTADAELGEIYFDASGTIVFEDRKSVYGQTRRTTSQGTFGDGGGELGYTGFALQTDDVQIFNDISITTNDLVTSTASDSTSITRFFDRKINVTLLCQDDNPAEGPGTASRMASFILSVLKDPDARVDSITVVPGNDPTNLWPQALGRELGDRITVKRRPPGRTSTPIVRDCFVRGVQHTFDPIVWITQFALQDATRSTVMVFDAGSAKFDTAKFGF